MPEPTDHRAEAIGRLRTAGDLSNASMMTSAVREAIIGEALIGIAHALLAGPVPDTLTADLERRMEALAQLFTAGGPIPTAAAVRTALRGDDQAHALLAQLQPIPDGRPGERCNHMHAAATCDLLGGHTGDHAIRWATPSAGPTAR